MPNLETQNARPAIPDKEPNRRQIPEDPDPISVPEQPGIDNPGVPKEQPITPKREWVPVPA